MEAQVTARFGPSTILLSVFLSTCVPNFMLVDKSAQYPPILSPRAPTIVYNCYNAVVSKDSCGRIYRGYETNFHLLLNVYPE